MPWNRTASVVSPDSIAAHKFKVKPITRTPMKRESGSQLFPRRWPRRLRGGQTGDHRPGRQERKGAGRGSAGRRLRMVPDGRWLGYGGHGRVVCQRVVHHPGERGNDARSARNITCSPCFNSRSPGA